jgi:putative flippase GtrA
MEVSATGHVMGYCGEVAVPSSALRRGQTAEYRLDDTRLAPDMRTLVALRLGSNEIGSRQRGITHGVSNGIRSLGVGLLDSLSRHSVLGRPARYLRERHVQVLYLVVGAWNTAFGYAEWALLQFLLHDRLHYLAILVLAWPIAVLNAYVCYRRFVFRSSRSVRQELPRFSLVYFGTLMAGLAALPFLLRTLPFNIYLIQAGYTVVVVILSYAAHRFFSFGGLQRSAGDAARKGSDDA